MITTLHAGAALCGLAFVSLVVSIHGEEESTFLSSSTTKEGKIGETIVFECGVDNLRTHSIDWWYLNEHLQISLNQHILVNDSHYSILQPLGSHGDMNHLQISPLKVSDAGHYQCKISGTNIVQTHTLYISDAPVLPKPSPGTLPAANFTACCMREDVRSSCLPVCSPSTMDHKSFQISDCVDDLDKLVKCGADSRNHIPCCRQRLVPDMCLGFCINDIPDPKPITCLSYDMDIIECFVQGQHLLPTEPFVFHVEAESASTIRTSWQPPVENSALVSGYRVFYKRTIDTAYQSTLVLEAGQLEHTLTGLEAATLYTLYVISISSHGASQPSPRLEVDTHSRNPLPPGVNRETFEQCCIDRGVSAQCRPVLCGEGPVQSDISMIDCFPEVNKVFQCMSGERNHTACCEKQEIPPECYSLCSGRVTNLLQHQLKCISLLPRISGCFNEGAKYIPGAPRDLVVQAVTSHSALIGWGAPLENEALIQRYTIRYWISQSDYVIEESVSGSVTRATVGGLEAATQYTIEVFAVGTNGSSIPSPGLLVITQPLLSAPTATEQPMSPVNETACCIESGVTEECLSLCDYQLNYDEVDVALFVSCQPDLGKMFACGTDGRNHTGCCQDRRVVPKCLPLCSFSQETAANFTFDYSHLECLTHLPDITMCMQEGLVSLPSPPQDVTASSTTQTITVAWRAPERVPAGETVKYHITWRNVKTNNISRAERLVLSYTIHNLMMDTEYSVEVIAATTDGYSLPAPLIIARTKPETLLQNVTLPTDMTDCCLEKGVSRQCLPACAGKDTLIDMKNCSRDLLLVLECAADGRNHQPCCERSDLPSQCLSHCRGQPQADSFLHLLCMTFVPQILSCFRQGYKDLPSPPENFRALETGPNFARFTWDPPLQNGQDVHYQLFYIGAYSTQDPKTVMDIERPYLLRDLHHSIPYTVYLVAYNDHGNSLSTPKIKFVTRANESPVITITQDPPDRYVKEGDHVKLSCHASGQPMPTVKWIRRGEDHNTQDLILGPLTKAHTGRYTCVAENGKQPVTENVILNVQYALVVTSAQPVVYVAPSEHRTAQLQCNVRGFPDTIRWVKDGVEISEAHSRYMSRREVQEDQGIIEAHFDIPAVQESDYGSYTCKVNNSFGSNHITIRLADPRGVTLAPGLTPAPPVLNVTSCCMVHGVRDSCLHICSFDVNLEALMSMSDQQQGECLQDGEKILSCAADGRNHTSCCIRDNLPFQCLPFCMGVVPEPLWKNQSSCVLYLEEIVDCMEEGHEVLPSQPVDLRGRLIDGFIQIWWDTPRTNPDKVNYYDIIYYNTNMSEFRNISLDSDVRVYNLTGVHSYSLYTIQVEARNHYGTSSKSNQVSIKTYEMLPSPPRDLSGASLTDARVLLHWNMPLKYPGTVASYNVYYAKTHFHPHYRKVNTFTPSLHYTLDGLDGSTNYSIYITAVSPHFQTNPSNVIQVQTEALISRPEKPSVSVVVPVVCALVVLAIIVAVALFVFWFFRIRRVKHQRFKDTVSFENPGYASHGAPNGSAGESGEPRAWISGLSSEAVMTTTGDSAFGQPYNSLVEGRAGVTVTTNGGIEEKARANGRGAKGGGGDLCAAPAGGDNGGAGIAGQGGATVDHSSIMRELDSNSDQGYATLSHSRADTLAPNTLAPAAGAEPHSYATLNITQPTDADHVLLDVDGTTSGL